MIELSDGSSTKLKVLDRNGGTVLKPGVYGKELDRNKSTTTWKCRENYLIESENNHGYLIAFQT